jgi:hypothetical protein
MKLVQGMALALLAGACAGANTDAAGPTTSSTKPSTISSAPATTTSTIAPTTTAPTTTAAPVEVDLINPVDGTLAGVTVGEGPVDPMIDSLTAAYGPPNEDSGWGPFECLAGTFRFLFWDALDLYLDETEGAQTVFGYEVEADAGVDGEVIELPDGIELGMSYAGAAELYPDDAYTHDSLELDGVVLQDEPLLRIVGQHSDDGSAPLTEVWVGLIPACD